MSIKTLLNEEIQDELSRLGKAELGTEPYKITVDGVTKLMDRAIELEKIEAERDDKAEALEREERLKLQQMRDDRIDKIVKNGLTLGTFIGSVCLYVWGAKSAFRFEETGTISSTMGRGYLGQLIPKLFKK